MLNGEAESTHTGCILITQKWSNRVVCLSRDALDFDPKHYVQKKACAVFVLCILSFPQNCNSRSIKHLYLCVYVYILYIHIWFRICVQMSEMSVCEETDISV